MRRQRDREGRARTRVGFDQHIPARLLDDAVNRRQAEARTRTDVLGREERLETMLEILLRNPDPAVGDIDHHIVTRQDRLATAARDEDIELRIAAVVTQLLPNGNMAIHGRQEIRLNVEARQLQVAGVIRPEDVTSTNTISYDQIAEARVS